MDKSMAHAYIYTNGYIDKVKWNRVCEHRWNSQQSIPESWNTNCIYTICPMVDVDVVVVVVATITATAIAITQRKDIILDLAKEREHFMMVKRDSKGAKNMLYICGRKIYHQRFVAVYSSPSLSFSFVFSRCRAKSSRFNCCASTIISIIIFVVVVVVVA